MSEIRGVGASVTVLKEETVAPRKSDSGGESGCVGDVGGWLEVIRVTGWGTRRIRSRKWVDSVSSDWGDCVEDGGKVVLEAVAAECS